MSSLHANKDTDRKELSTEGSPLQKEKEPYKFTDDT